MRRLFPVVLSLSFSLSFVAAGTPPLGVTRSTAGEEGLFRAGAPMEGRARLMAPDVYDRLSSGGRRLARSWNGLRGPARVIGTPRAALGNVLPLGTPSPRQNVRVNDPTLDEAGHTNSESSVAVSGSTIVVGFNDAAIDTSAYAFSTDGGATFTHRRLSPPFDGLLYGDPVLAAGPAGEVYYASLISVAGDALSSIGVSKSTDGGQTFEAPVDAVNANTFTDEIMDKPWLAVDAGAGSKYRGNVYVSWTFLNTSTSEAFILFARSTDGGLTFSAPGILSPDDTVGVQGSSIAVGPAGEVYVAWLDEHLSPSGISIRKSSDGGANFGPTVTVAKFRELTMLTGEAASAPTASRASLSTGRDGSR